MAKSNLVSAREEKALTSPWFPTEFHATIFRLWSALSPSKMAEIFNCSEKNVRCELTRMGLDPDAPINPLWRKRGYITLIRDTWHTLTMEQQCRMLDITQEELDTILREDDFLWVKFGCIKPITEGAKYEPPTEETVKRCQEICEFVKKTEEKFSLFPDSAFEFVHKYYEKTLFHEKIFPDFKNQNLRFIYSYFALYGDPLIDEELDPFPDKLLEEYANYGVNGIWLQGVLYQLSPYPFCPELSEGYEKRVGRKGSCANLDF